MRKVWTPLLVAVGFALLAALVALLARIVVLPWIESVSGWVIPTDAWAPLPAARSVANGDVFGLYQPLAGRTGYPYTPLLPILLAPAPLIGDRYHLLGDPIFTHTRPTMFLLLGPMEAFVGVFPIVYVAGRAIDATRARLIQLQAATFFVAAWAPAGWFHPEDTIVVALLVAACLRADDDDETQWRRIGVYLGLALLFKQWAIIAMLPLLAAAPSKKLATTAFYAWVLPAIVLVPFLLSSPETLTSLRGTRASLDFGQPQIWMNTLFGSSRLADGNTLHLVWAVVALAIAWCVRTRGGGTDLTLAGVGAVMLARLLFEPTLFGYYLVPATTIALIWCARNARPFGLRAFTAFWLIAFCMPHTYPQPVFFAMLAFGLGYVCGPMLAALLPAGAIPSVRFVRYVARG